MIGLFKTFFLGLAFVLCFAAGHTLARHGTAGSVTKWLERADDLRTALTNAADRLSHATNPPRTEPAAVTDKEPDAVAQSTAAGKEPSTVAQPTAAGKEPDTVAQPTATGKESNPTAQPTVPPPPTSTPQGIAGAERRGTLSATKTQPQPTTPPPTKTTGTTAEGAAPPLNPNRSAAAVTPEPAKTPQPDSIQTALVNSIQTLRNLRRDTQ